jgi:hypothetical protein
MKAYNVYALSDNNIKKIVENQERRSPLAMLSFIHFLEVEDQAQVMREISSSTNVDTKKSGNLYQAKSRISKLEQLEDGTRLPNEITLKLENESSIAPFFIQDYILNVFQDYFPLRASNTINSYLVDIINKNYNTIREEYKDVESFVDLFRNDLLQFIIQNSIGSVDISTVKDYKGYAVNDAIDVEKVRGLKRSAVYYEGKIYLDRAKLREEYSNKTYSKNYRSVDYNLHFETSNTNLELLGLYRRQTWLKLVKYLQSIRKKNAFLKEVSKFIISK